LIKQETKNSLNSFDLLMKRVKVCKVLILMILPCIIYKLIFCYIPMIGAIIAFRKFSYQTPIIGTGPLTLHYFKMFFVDTYDAWPVIKNTLLLNLYSFIFGFPAPIILALLFNEIRGKRIRKLCQTAAYIPNFISTVALCGMLSLILAKDTGFVNKIVELLGGERIMFLTKPEWFRTIFIASGIWQTAGWGCIIFLATIAGIDAQLYEAAYIDGANRIKQIRYITLPGIKNVTILLLIFQMGSMLSSNTEKILLLYKPIIFETADVIGTYVYRMGLMQGSVDPSYLSMGSAIGLFNSVISLFLVIIANTVARKYSEISLW
jgi:putative aldouronate transport system permease protein